jgi:hypothetical protein
LAAQPVIRPKLSDLHPRYGLDPLDGVKVVRRYSCSVALFAWAWSVSVRGEGHSNGLRFTRQADVPTVVIHSAGLKLSVIASFSRLTNCVTNPKHW